MIRYGVIGTGYITERMINGAKLFPEQLTLTAVCSRDEERGRAFAEKTGASHVFTSVEDLASFDGIDMVYIASPNVCHLHQARLCLEGGKHVLCEKPLSANPEEVKIVQDYAASKGLLFREAIMMLYQPAWKILQEAVKEIGNISLAQFQFCQLSSKYDSLCAGEMPNIFNPALHTGTLMDLGVYCVYPALALFGKPKNCSAFASIVSTGSDGAGGALLNYGDKTVVLYYSKVAQGFSQSEILGDKGSITIESISKLSGITLHRPGQPDRLLYGEDDKELLMGREIHAFAESIEQNEAMGGEKDRLALDVSCWMYAIREASGIRFPEENIL